MKNNKRNKDKQYFRFGNFQNNISGEQAEDNEKTATNNQWISTGLNPDDDRERRDGPGGEDYLGK